MPRGATIKGQTIKKWLEKWPNIPNLQLARMIYNADNNHLLFTSVDTVRSQIRRYKGASGEWHRKVLKDKKYIKPLKNLIYVQST